MSDLFGNHIVGFPTRWLICEDGIVEVFHMSRPMGKPTICMGENKGADQLRGNREADQRLCFRYSDSTIPPLLKSEISSFYLFSVLAQAGLCWTCSKTTLLVFPRGGSYLFKKLCISVDLVFNKL